MSILFQWAADWGISAAALDDLTARLVYEAETVAGAPKTSEGYEQAEIRKECAGKNILLWRNNVGALVDARGRTIRFGLCNESKKLNEKFKSSDLIGVRCNIITPDMVGQKIGQFICREVKKSGWKFNPADPHTMAQTNFLLLVAAHGGDARFATGNGSL
jgi:hypothetical protein